MDGDDFGRLVYLVILGGALATYFIVANRARLGQVLRHAVLWGVIFIGCVAGVGLWQDIRGDFAVRQARVTDTGRIEIPRAQDGHYYLTLEADEVPIRFVVDTGATNIVLSRQDAGRIGVDPDSLRYLGIANTANGRTRTARTMLSTLSLGPIVERDVAVWVNEGEMEDSLLGMDYLQRFERIEISDGTLVLTR
ncbi:MAG: TIGR02281 family clan AA aspartic protease [Rhodobacter sp.]|nr:TIGR02281 family clan AA aspartic protease [Rhodobacter sp.]MCY4169045.1 TIGR02281 family clan AA aspartic protease [Rhodobacter sp.]MCY4240842.1 TIGR02281 family clan AA aspartic protease [Rhodobacter sp.]